MPLIRKLTNPELYPDRASQEGALIIPGPGPGARHLGTTLKAQSLLKKFKLANPKQLTLPYLALPAESPGKAMT